ncbi:MAG: hypothetical protein QM765_51510 [Myxococcales bacterium]
MNRYWDAPMVKIFDVTICGPIKSWVGGGNAYHPGKDESEVDFDDPFNTPGTMKDGGLIGVGGGDSAMAKGFERTRLRIQVRLNQKLIIPLANWVIFRSWMGMGTNKLIRMGDKNAWDFKGASKNKRLQYDIGYKEKEGGKVRWSNDKAPDPVKTNSNNLWLAAVGLKRYFIPLYANYGFRMQSNFYLSECPLPEKNECFHYKSDDPNP